MQRKVRKGVMKDNRGEGAKQGKVGEHWDQNSKILKYI